MKIVDCVMLGRSLVQQCLRQRDHEHATQWYDRYKWEALADLLDAASEARDARLIMVMREYVETTK